MKSIIITLVAVLILIFVVVSAPYHATKTRVQTDPTTFTGGTITVWVSVAPVSPGERRPTGYVTFDDGACVLGTAPLNASSAELATPILTIGEHPITATYLGDDFYRPSTSPASTIYAR